MANKIEYGIENVHYSLITEAVDGTYTYATPKALKGAKSIKLTPEGEKLEVYADNIAYYVEESNQGYQGELELLQTTEEFEIEVLGLKKDTKGTVVESSEDKIQKIALLFEFTGDKKKTRHCLFNVVLARPNIESKTKEKSTDPVSKTLTFTASPHPKTKYTKAKAYEGTANYTAWFTTVVTPTMA